MSDLIKTVFVTGASRGIGRATSIAFAKAGYRVAISARQLKQSNLNKIDYLNSEIIAEGLEHTVGYINALGFEALPVEMDLLDRKSVEAAINHVLKYYGAVDVIINNAIYQGTDLNKPVMELTEATLLNVAKAYIISPIQIIQALLPIMKKSTGGRIINITSGAGESDPPLTGDNGGWGFAYGAGKAALSRLAGVINREHKEANIHAFTVNPGVVDTETLRATIGAANLQKLGNSVAEPEQIAKVLLWLAETTHTEKFKYKTIQAQKLMREIVC